MNVSEVFTMLNANTVDFEKIRSDGHAIPALTPEMISQACAGLDPKFMLAALIKISGDINQAKRLVDPWLLGDISKRVVKENWDIKKGDLKAMCELAVFELHSPSMFDTDEKRSIALSMNTQRIIVGLEYSKKYRRYYNMIFSVADDYCNTAISHLKKKWGADDE